MSCEHNGCDVLDQLVCLNLAKKLKAGDVVTTQVVQNRQSYIVDSVQIPSPNQGYCVGLRCRRLDDLELDTACPRFPSRITQETHVIVVRGDEIILSL